MKGVFIIDCNKYSNHTAHNQENKKELTGGSKSHYKTYRYDELVDALIKAEKIKYLYPKLDVVCSIDRSAMSDPDIRRSFEKVYDQLILNDDSENGRSKLMKTIKKYRSNGVKHVPMHLIGSTDVEFDNDYEYGGVKKKIGTELSKHFMFKEHDLLIDLKGGFNPNNKKIKFKKDFDPRFVIVCKLYKLFPKSCNQIKKYHLDYLHTDRRHRYNSPIKISPMFSDIDCYDYYKPIYLLSKYHGPNSYYTTILNKYSSVLKELRDKSTPLHTTDLIDPIDRDLIALEYIKCRPNMFIITIWMPVIYLLDKFLEFLHNEGEISYIKTVNFSKKGLKNLMYQMYDEFPHSTAMNFAEKKLSYINAQDTNNTVCFVMFDNVKLHNISGPSAPYKVLLRNKLIELGQIDQTIYMGNDLIHINDYYYQTIEYSQLVLNENSLNALEHRECDKYGYYGWTLAHLKFQTLRNVMYANMSILEIGRLIALGGVTMYANSVRAFNDIDFVIIDIEPNVSNEFTKTVEKLFSNDLTKIFFFDGAIKGTKYWRNSWDESDRPIMDILNINSHNDLVLNPKYHMYYQGVKIVNLEFELIRKLIRNRVDDHVDFVMIQSTMPKLIEDYLSVVIEDGEVKFIPTEKYSKITGKPKNSIVNRRYEILERRYSIEQIEDITDTTLFKRFFDKDNKNNTSKSIIFNNIKKR